MILVLSLWARIALAATGDANAVVPTAAATVEPAPVARPPQAPIVKHFSGEARVQALLLARSDDPNIYVHDGRGHIIDVRTWAALTGDTDALKRALQRRGASYGWPLRALGIAAIAGGLTPALAAYSPSDPPGTPHWKEDSTRNDALAALGFALVGTGVGLVAASFTVSASSNPGTPLYRVVKPADADVAIAAYNARVRAELGR